MYREILTKAIIAKGKKNIKESLQCDVNNNVSKVLGCWIINHQNEVYKDNQKIFIKGSYEINLWYGYDDNTKCGMYSFLHNFNDEIPYTFTLEKVTLDSKNDVKSYVIVEPSCLNMTFLDKEIFVDIIREYEIDIIGETKLRIKVDDVAIDQMIDTNYMKDIPTNESNK